MSTVGPVILGEMPSLSKLYVNAAAQAARRRVLGTNNGSNLPATSHEVRGVRADVGNLTAYQHLIGLSARDTLPAGYLHALAFPLAMSVMNRDDFPLPLLGMVHLSNHVEQRSPVLFTESLDIQARVENLRGHRAGTQLDVVSEIRGADTPDIKWTGRSSYLAKGVFLPGIDKPTPHNRQADFTPPDPTAIWHLGVDTGRAYAAVSGDFNPIHLSVLSAKALGMRRSIAHGMYLASRALADVGPAKGETFTWDVTFESPVFLPARVALEITTGQTPGEGWQRSDFVAWNPRSGRRHFSGSVASL
ncbi:MaoC/PaaZ C-terminal domain-containing protein [Pseudarthrobacter sp. AL07]|uniref:MaoC family dehydratase n=1 Tax=unclassified Pseudarthrobacter TaxID=2647000 RepID=UPI00249AE002|nr:MULTISPECIES: MaoC/PaaZ C-terminal domain-containing protein [unclassified Pseudarthrobacter]MDI3195740.1 MaoC/PaaZ C-terminal domain-containing protein [Pseudarthrobacter sp. AL20]MDI3209812.1 MaoC/PaaZ C-terminal domain-containing protein [Pseudarthrobacter sp. AL07]